ncbi:MAG: histidine kinase, partial [Lachnospiraceae bacterium]|nr:histidine kinase [Lachnospiraceae bacterium]
CFDSDRGDKYLAWFMPFVVMVSIFNTLLLIASQFNGMLYYIDERNVYHRGSFLYFSFFFTGLTLAAFFFLLIREKKNLKMMQFIVLLSFALIPGLILLLQPWVQGKSFLFTGLTVCFATLFTVELMRQKERIERQTMDIRERDAVIREMQTSIALSQIKPHFLYNCLNSIYVLCGKDLELGRRGISDLSDYLRANIGSIDSRIPIAFEKEKEHVIKYLDLEKLRFPDEFSYSFFTPVTDFTLPALTLQPLVENAVRHGVVPVGKDGIILITTRETDKHYVITVSDNGVGFDPEAPVSKDDKADHIGIRNVRERLKRLSGGELEIQSVINYGTEVIIRIPKE